MSGAGLGGAAADAAARTGGARAEARSEEASAIDLERRKSRDNLRKLMGALKENKELQRMLSSAHAQTEELRSQLQAALTQAEAAQSAAADNTRTVEHALARAAELRMREEEATAQVQALAEALAMEKRRCAKTCHRILSHDDVVISEKKSLVGCSCVSSSQLSSDALYEPGFLDKRLADYEEYIQAMLMGGAPGGDTCTSCSASRSL
eukprot:3644360-Pleurochrysis_carterae.AAC.2